MEPSPRQIRKYLSILKPQYRNSVQGKMKNVTSPSEPILPLSMPVFLPLFHDTEVNTDVSARNYLGVFQKLPLMSYIAKCSQLLFTFLEINTTEEIFLMI